MKHETLRKIVPAAVIAAAASVAIATSQEGGSKTYSARELREHAALIANRDTGCYALGQGAPLTSRSEIVQGVKQNIISIPVHDTSTHKPGQDSWPNDVGVNQDTNLLESGFTVSYSTVGGKHLETPAQGLIREAKGTTPQSTEYNVELGVGTNPGPWVADIYYAADVFVGNKDQTQTLRGTRLCGSVGFNVENDGSISGIHILEPTDEVGQLHIAPNPHDSPSIENWYTP